MKVNICNEKDKVENIGDAYVIDNMCMFFQNFLVVKAEDGVYLVSGDYNYITGIFEVLDVETPAVFISKASGLSVEDIINRVVDDIELPNGTYSCKFDLE